MDGTTDLVNIVDSQFESLRAIEAAEEMTLAVSRLVEFLRRDARLTGVVDELHADSEVVLESFRERDRDTRTALRAAWAIHGPSVVAMREEIGVDARIEATFGQIERFDERLASPPVIAFRRDALTQQDPGELDACFRALEHWISFGHDPDASYSGGIRQGPEWVWLREFAMTVKGLREAHMHAWETFRISDRTLGGPAFDRLACIGEMLNPAPTSDVLSEAFQLSRSHADVREEVLGRNGGDDGKRMLRVLELSIRRDLRIVHQELRTKILTGRSRLSLIRRFAGRCMRYEAPRLRAMVTQDPERAEAMLTVEFARYLYDHGLTPFIDAKVAGLRPDVFEPGDFPVYVEAKQYSAAPAAMIKKAVGQVFDTWARLEPQTIDEAFLLVFRVGGSGVLLPPIVRVGTRRLYLVLADIAPADESGSQQKERSVSLTEDDLRPDQATA